MGHTTSGSLRIRALLRTASDDARGRDRSAPNGSRPPKGFFGLSRTVPETLPCASPYASYYGERQEDP